MTYGADRCTSAWSRTALLAPAARASRAIDGLLTVRLAPHAVDLTDGGAR